MIPMHWIGRLLFGEGPERAHDDVGLLVIPILPRMTAEGWLVWLWPVWQTTGSSGGWDSYAVWYYSLKRPKEYISRWPRPYGIDRFMLAMLLVLPALQLLSWVAK